MDFVLLQVFKHVQPFRFIPKDDGGGVFWWRFLNWGFQVNVIDLAGFWLGIEDGKSVEDINESGGGGSGRGRRVRPSSFGCFYPGEFIALRRPCGSLSWFGGSD